GSHFGFGFGLNMEFRLSSIIAFQTGIGGDFEGGNYQFKNELGKYEATYFQNSTTNEFVAPKNNENITDIQNTSNTGYVLADRTIKTTHVSIPAILKMSTNEYSGFKYFGMFGVELGIRVKATATDNYSTSYKYKADGSKVLANGDGPSSQSNININKDASLIPLRLGLNVGGGTEYRIGGSTSAFISINYFRSFTNLQKSDSKYIVYHITTDSGNLNTYNFVKQNLIMSAIRINLGILF
ncbi:MAG: hypothetical protein JWO32_2394, partial [Bacteroidetes bacterium]|nr:hypothetical protein [Bacteroidota bacterium]